MATSPDTVHSVEIDIAELPTKSVTFAPTKATIIREINDIQIKPRENEIIIRGLDPKLLPDSVRVDGYGSATITNIQTELIPRKESFEDVYPEHEEDDELSDPDMFGLDDDHRVDKTAVDVAKQEVREAEAVLAASKNAQETANKLVQFLDRYGNSMEAQKVESLKLTEFLDIYREQRIVNNQRYQLATTEIIEQQNELNQARKKLVQAEKAYEKAKKAATREIRQLREKKAREKLQKQQEKQRKKDQLLQFWSSEVAQVVINLDGSSAPTASSSRRSSIISSNEKYPADSLPLNEDSVNIRLTYVVPSARWEPRYELSINTPASSAKLVYRAQFENKTAETWKNAKVTFSTSQASFSGLNEKLPILDPWHIRLVKASMVGAAGNTIWSNGLQSKKELMANNAASAARISSVDRRGKAKIRTNLAYRGGFGSSDLLEVSRQAPAAYASLFGSAAHPPPPPPSAPRAGRLGGVQGTEEASEAANEGDYDQDDALTLNPEHNVLGYQDSQRQDYGLTTTYDIPGQRTVNPSMVPRRHVIAELDLTSLQISHVIVPKLRCAAFLKARITNTTSVSLIQGKAGMTVDGTFLGSTTLPTCEPANFVDLSLGVDPSIQVTYAKPTVRRATSGFFAKDDCAVFTRTCWIRNTKKVTTSITVIDQVPVSEDENLRVNIIEPRGLERDASSTNLDDLFQKGEKGRGKVQLEKNGKIKWTLDIRPGKDVKLVLEYESRIPNGQAITGLD